MIRFPTGHLTKIVKREEYNITIIVGLFLYIAPRGLYLPVLLYKQKAKQSQKLLFGLCRTCVSRIDQSIFVY